ncbi:MAG: 4a-hydroxytetrahydrobiopterin dehydratase [Thermaerobacter sp.]|nr:MAG: 4a-hydroxytetrahydrobiopterin dehydratase [Bacillota bacterium]
MSDSERSGSGDIDPGGQLAAGRCVPCQAGAPAVTAEELARYRSQIPDWTVLVDGGSRRLRRIFTFKDFAEALDFTNRVAELAEREGHHPRLVLEWGRVTVDWWTHKIQDLHMNDLIMAAKTDALYGNGPA